MANKIQMQPLHLGQYGTPDTYNESTLPRGGEIGQVLEVDQKSYQLVKHDSGATASTAIGVSAAKQLAFWKDRANYLVTNDSVQTEGGSTSNAYRNFVAGVYRAAITAGNYCLILQRGNNINVKEASSGGGVGQNVIAASTNTASVAFVAVGTATTYQSLGIAREAGDATDVGVDLDIPSAP